jgi:hypothetical protein
MHPDDLRRLELPRRASHGVDCIRPANADSEHAQTSSIGRVRVYSRSAKSKPDIMMSRSTCPQPKEP